MKVWAIDIDGILIDKGKPIKKNIKKINKLYQQKDNLIIIYTARPTTMKEETKKWLKENKINYHLLIFGKLKADYYVDDKMIKW